MKINTLRTRLLPSDGVRTIIICLGLLFVAAMLLFGCGDDGDTEAPRVKSSTDPASVSDSSNADNFTGAQTVVGSIETLDGIKFYCFRYTTVDRGGLWCERAS